MNKSYVISAFLKALARHVERLSDDELEKALESAGFAGIFHSRPKSKSISKVEKWQIKEEAERLVSDLERQTSREGAERSISRTDPTRRVLIEAAKMRDVHVTRQDTVVTISQKLVENLVGSRLDSARIRGPEHGWRT